MIKQSQWHILFYLRQIKKKKPKTWEANLAWPTQTADAGPGEFSF